MLSSLVGAVDVPAAGVLIAMFIAMAVVLTTFLTLYTSKQETSNRFELAKMARDAETKISLAREDREHEKDLARIASNREVEIRRIDTGMLDLQTAKQRSSD